MAKSFSSFSASDAQAIAQGFNPNATGFIFSDPATPTYVQARVPGQFFLDARKNIESRWNLDRSEAARRVYVDLYLHEAIHDGTFSSIITVEEYLAQDNNYLGFGFLDYIVSSISNDGAVQYHPSIVIEAKKGMDSLPNRAKYEWQLLAEMATLKQRSNLKRNFYYGILSDGRFWSFYSVAALVERKTNQVPVMRSPLYDTRLDDSGQKDDLTLVLGALRKWMQLYGNSEGNLPLFGN